MKDPVIGYITLGVVDFERSVKFFRDVIGFPLLFTDDGFKFARFQSGGVTFAVVRGFGGSNFGVPIRYAQSLLKP